MSKDNVESARRAIAAFNTGDIGVLRDGKTTRVEEYLNPAEALEPLGLVE
jgi:hypothetical protein